MDYEQLYYDQLAERQMFKYPLIIVLIYVYLKHRKGYSGFGGGYHGGHSSFRIGRQGYWVGQTAGGPYQTLFIKKMIVKVEQNASIKESA